MISRLLSLPAGNAIRVFQEIPNGATRSIILRKLSDAFAGHDDADAFQVADSLDKSVLDVAQLQNGVLYYYKAYHFVSGVWAATASMSASPSASYTDKFTDVHSLLRERIELGLRVEVERGVLRHDNGQIPVFTAPPIFEETIWPIVTVHMQNDSSGSRGIGEMIGADAFDDESDVWSEAEGWHANVQILIVGWSMNPDERNILRRAIRRVIQANLPIFDDAGMYEVSLSQQDTDDFETYSANVYLTSATFSCIAPAAVGSTVDAIKRVEVTQFCD